jgi:HD domain
MTIPSRSEAARLLRSLEPPEWFLRHACAVADVAAWLARRAAARGLDVDSVLVDTGALLHDVDKLPAGEIRSVVGPRSAMRHGDGSAAWLEDRDWGELAPVVRDHAVIRLADPGFESWVASASLEALIVAYADKRAGQRLGPMAERFASWHRRYPTGEWSDDVAWHLVETRARELERVVCAAAGVDPSEVRRLRWARRALREAAT